MEKQFNEQESLNLISEMISQARNNIEIGAANNLLFSGYSVAITAILNFILYHVLDKPEMSYWVWLLMIPMYLINFMVDLRREKGVLVKTHIDTIISGIWGSFGYACALFIAVIFGLVFVMQTWVFTLVIIPVIMVMTGIAIFSTAVACRYKPFYRSAYIFWIAALATIVWLFFFKEGSGQFIILAIAMILGFIIPAHVLNRKAKKNV